MNFGDNEEIFVIGGGEIYKKFLDFNLIDRMYITHIDEFFEGDTFFPDVNLDNWNSTEIMKHIKDNKNPHNFKIMYKGKFCFKDTKCITIFVSNLS